jgi:hypothetical protein
MEQISLDREPSYSNISNIIGDEVLVLLDSAVWGNVNKFSSFVAIDLFYNIDDCVQDYLIKKLFNRKV